MAKAQYKVSSQTCLAIKAGKVRLNDKSHLFVVFRVPETATVLLSGGVTFADLSEEQAFQFQKDLLCVMMNIEQTYFNLAKTEALKGNKCLVICDRGTMDASAYIKKSEWARILQELNLNEIEIRDHRYDIVCHLITAADGAKEFYNLGTNHARSEDLEHAIRLDDLCKNAWIGHPYFDLIDNSTDFDTKCNRVVGAVLKRLGLPDRRFSSEFKKFKFLVKKDFQLKQDFPVPYQDFEVEHIFLPVKDGNQSRVRRRTQAGVSHYNITTTKVSKADNIIEYRRSLTGREFEALIQQGDESRVPIMKKRRCFIYDNRTFQLDFFLTPESSKGTVLLEAYLPRNCDTKNLPEFIPIEKDVTDVKEYFLSEIALKK